MWSMGLLVKLVIWTSKSQLLSDWILKKESGFWVSSNQMSGNQIIITICFQNPDIFISGCRRIRILKRLIGDASISGYPETGVLLYTPFNCAYIFLTCLLCIFNKMLQTLGENAYTWCRKRIYRCGNVLLTSNHQTFLPI